MIIYGIDRNIITDTNGTTITAAELKVTTDNWVPCVIASNRPEILRYELHAPEGFTVITKCETIEEARGLVGRLALAIAENKRFVALCDGKILEERL